MTPNHPGVSLSESTTKSGRTHIRRRGKTGGVAAPKPNHLTSDLPDPPFVLDQDGHFLPANQYDPSAGHIYVGPHHACANCLVRQVPEPQRVCASCARPQPAAVSA